MATASPQLGASTSRLIMTAESSRTIKRGSFQSALPILMTLSVQTISALDAGGTPTLSASADRAINQVLREKEGFGGIDNVYFTNLVIQ